MTVRSKPAPALTVPGTSRTGEAATDGWEIPPCESGKRGVPLLSATDTAGHLEMGPNRDLASRSEAGTSNVPAPISGTLNVPEPMLEQLRQSAIVGAAWCDQIDAAARTAVPPTTTLIAPRAAYRGSRGTLEALRAWLPKQGQR